MAAGFNNYNSTVQNQVIGVLNVDGGREKNIALVQQKLDDIMKRIEYDSICSRSDTLKLIQAVDEVRNEIKSVSPKKDALDLSLSVIDRISSVASLAAEIRALISWVF